MNILFIGDVVGKPGRDAVKYFLENNAEALGLDFVIANLENVSHGKGLQKNHFLEMMESGIDVATMGNHTFAKKTINEFINDYDNLLRPANIHPSLLGHGSDIYEVDGLKIRVTNLLGRVYMSDNNDNPFDALKTIVDNDNSDIHIVDFHAEATGEKLSLGFAFDGLVSAVIGTHTHIQTNDLRLLPKGTLFLSDAGMCGPRNGILGSSREEVIRRTWTGSHEIFEVMDDDEYIFNGVLFTIDENTKKVIDYQLINEIIKKKEINNG